MADNLEDITGTLEDWLYRDGRLYGKLYGDIHNRWEDGAYIHTSSVATGSLVAVQPKFEEGEIIQTRNSRYKLGKKSEPQEVSAKIN